MNQRKLLLPVAGAAVLGAVALVATGTSAVSADKRPDVIVSATPDPVQLNGMPCSTTIVKVGMENTTKRAFFEHLMISEDTPLEPSRTLWSTYLPPSEPEVVTTDLSLSVPRGTPVGEHQVDLIVDDEVRKTFTAEVVPAPVKGPDDNLLLEEEVTASSTIGGFTPCSVVNGNVDGSVWPGNGWNDSTAGVWPDTFDVTIPAARPIGKVVVHTLGTTKYPAAKYGLKDYNVQIRTGGTWTTVDQVRGNTEGVITSTFTPQPADGVRLEILMSNSGDYSRLVEIEAYAK